MPIFIDRHDLGGMTAKDIADAHLKDLEIQGKYGVKMLTYWFDEARGAGFCLIEAPDAETATRVHAEAHGFLPVNIVPVDLSAVEAFLGRVADPVGDAHGKGEIEAAFRTVMFTDIVGSTSMTERLGDKRGTEMVRAHDAIVRRSLRDESGREVKHTGDGIMAAFDAAEEAVRCARAIQVGFETFNMASDVPIHVRIGLDAGEPVTDNNDLFGHTVQKAARICAAASGDEILVTNCLHTLVADKFDLCSRGELKLKGFAHPEQVFEVGWR